MNWLRKCFVGLLAVILLLSLLGIAATSNAVYNLSKPQKIEKLLADSGIYDKVVSSALDQSKNTASGDDTGSVSPTDPAVQQAAEAVFTPQLIEQSVNSFINSNYSWLNGKTAKPDFVIDLTAAKQQFAQTVGAAVTKHLSGLPVCTPDQLAQIELPADPLAVQCRPAELNAQTEGQRVADTISNGDFLSKSIVTADSLGQDEQSQATPTKPYYTKFSSAPKLYKLATYAPLALAVVVILSALGIVYISRDRRRGVRRVGIIALEAGVILIVTKFFADFASNKLQSKLLHNAAAGLKDPTASFVDKLESQLVMLNLVFGIIFVIVAIIIFVILFRTREDSAKPKPSVPQEVDEQPEVSEETPAPRRRAASPAPASQAPANDLASRLKPRESGMSGPPPLKSMGKTPPKRKPPKLIQ